MLVMHGDKTHAISFRR